MVKLRKCNLQNYVTSYGTAPVAASFVHIKLRVKFCKKSFISTSELKVSSNFTDFVSRLLANMKR